MSEIYGSQFANQFGDVDGEGFQTWCLGLRDQTAQSIKRGFSKLLQRESKFVPNLNEFRDLCSPSLAELGIPSEHEAYTEAAMNARRVTRHPWSHPIVYHAGSQTGWFMLVREAEAKTRPAFKKIYAALIERIRAGEVFQLPERASNQLEHHTHGDRVTTQQSRKAGEKALNSLKESFR
ncbi:replication protein P [Pontibacter sp. JAM-7]|uniref:replication protein P n=1 Tax=Pontibacter sp. JAM-7 TaxID=3366581 RepID=UPI003AF6B621